MFSTLTLGVPVLAAAAAMAASSPRSGSHSGLAKRLEGNSFSFGKRETFTNIEMTWYPTDTGPYALSSFLRLNQS